MTDFQSILNTPASAVKPPQALPTGTYLCLVDGPAEITQRGQKQNNCAIFKLKPVQVQKDVDEERLRTSLDGASLSDKKINHTLWLTEDAKFRVVQFLDNLGIEKGTKTIGEMLSEVPGKQVLVTLGHRASEDGSTVYHEVKSTAKV